MEEKGTTLVMEKTDFPLSHSSRVKIKRRNRGKATAESTAMAESTATAESTVSMTLLIDVTNGGKRVLFAEAGKDCVDFLFNILSLPLAAVIRLLREEGMVGALPKLYKSLENLNDDYIELGKKKESYLKPAYAEDRFLLKPSCNGLSLVKGVVRYMVMDDLEIKPLSNISTIALLNEYKVKDVGALEEKVVNLGMKEAIKLLKASLESQKVLTDVFC